ncbi:hypothetical protein B9Z51_12630 [Limnohabitans sp. T6-5]|nr:hypothetical protein B9Z51_12630 [Limnohabitans sp. T6-5]
MVVHRADVGLFECRPTRLVTFCRSVVADPDIGLMDPEALLGLDPCQARSENFRHKKTRGM